MEQARGGKKGKDHLVADVHRHQADLLLQDKTRHNIKDKRIKRRAAAK
jgi:hypothetical protein